MKYICATNECGVVSEANSFEHILVREKLCRKCFLDKHYRVTDHVTIRPREQSDNVVPRPKSKYVCFDCGWVSHPFKNSPARCNTCNSLAMFKTDLIQD